jgi:heme-degrading monooxygenase HmoA
MIVRAWRGRASPANPRAYVEHFRRTVLPALRQLDGFLGASLLREDRAEGVEFLVLTRWASMDAVRAFAGDDVRKAVVEPEAVAALTDFDPTVRHYEVVEESPGSQRP